MLLDYCWKCRMKTRDVRANHLAATSSQVQLLDFSPNTNRCYVPVPGEDNDEDEEENDGQYGGCQEALLQGGQGVLLPLLLQQAVDLVERLLTSRPAANQDHGNNILTKRRAAGYSTVLCSQPGLWKQYSDQQESSRLLCSQSGPRKQYSSQQESSMLLCSQSGPWKQYSDQ